MINIQHFLTPPPPLTPNGDMYPLIPCSYALAFKNKLFINRTMNDIMYFNALQISHLYTVDYFYGGQICFSLLSYD